MVLIRMQKVLTLIKYKLFYICWIRSSFCHFFSSSVWSLVILWGFQFSGIWTQWQRWLLFSAVFAESHGHLIGLGNLCALSPLIPFTVNTTPQIQSTTISHCSHCVLPTISRLSILSWSLESRLLLKLTSFWIEPLSTPILLMSFFSIKPRNLFSQSNVGLCSLMRPLWVQPHGHDLQFHSSFFLSQSFHFFKIIF